MCCGNQLASADPFGGPSATCAYSQIRDTASLTAVGTDSKIGRPRSLRWDVPENRLNDHLLSPQKQRYKGFDSLNRPSPS